MKNERRFAPNPPNSPNPPFWLRFQAASHECTRIAPELETTQTPFSARSAVSATFSGSTWIHMHCTLHQKQPKRRFPRDRPFRPNPPFRLRFQVIHEFTWIAPASETAQTLFSVSAKSVISVRSNCLLEHKIHSMIFALGDGTISNIYILSSRNG